MWWYKTENEKWASFPEASFVPQHLYFCISKLRPTPYRGRLIVCKVQVWQAYHLKERKTKYASYSTQAWASITQKMNKCSRHQKNRHHKLSQIALCQSVRVICQKYKAVSSYKLTEKLRPSIFGWANYYRHSECSQVFSRLQYLIWQKLRAWLFRRSPKQSRGHISHTYFPVGLPMLVGTARVKTWAIAPGLISL